MIKDEEIPILSEEVVLLIERNSKALSPNVLSTGFKMKRQNKKCWLAAKTEGQLLLTLY